MRLPLLTLCAFALPSLIHADDWVNGYTRRDGSFVQGHYRSDNDGQRWNNYSTQGNSNPYTGESGNKPIYEGYCSPRNEYPSERTQANQWSGRNRP